MSSEKDLLLGEDEEQTQVRADLSHVSFENLQKLKERLGSKVYNEAMFGTRKVKKVKFKRENKNRPREMSAKKTVSRFKEIISVKKNVPRDPRFDSLCGTFNVKAFNNSYAFLEKTRAYDLKVLKKELKGAEDPDTINKIKYLIQRLENQEREENKKKKKEEQKRMEKQEIVETFKQGKKPVFKKKSEKRILNLVSQYEELKNSGKLKKHIQRLRKKKLSKERKNLTVPDMM